jgi:hypothetical protein
MVERMRAAISAPIAFLVLIAGSITCFADTLDAGLFGAWSASAPDCPKIFQRSGGAVAFRQPIDKFAQAAIIGPRQFLLPSGACRVQSVSHAKGVTTVSAECTDSISYRTENIEIKVTSDGITYGDTNMVRCRL